MGLLWRLIKSGYWVRLVLLLSCTPATKLTEGAGCPASLEGYGLAGYLPEKVFNRCRDRFVLGTKAKPAIGSTKNHGEQDQVNHDQPLIAATNSSAVDAKASACSTVLTSTMSNLQPLRSSSSDFR